MNKRLMYKEYKRNKNIIIIDLHNNYSVIAIKNFNKDRNIYTVDFMIKENTISKWDAIEKAENIESNVNNKIINSVILKYVATFLNEGFFDYYIKRFEYELKCFDIGNETLERSKIGK